MKKIYQFSIWFYTIAGIVLACTFSPLSHGASVSDLLITEIMANPLAVSDPEGEWFELYNPTTESISLNDIVISDDNSLGHAISSSAELLIHPDSYFVLARNDDSNLNGGFNADYTYSRFTLANTRDQIIFSDGTGELLRFEYEAGFTPNGASMELIGAVMLSENYAAATTTFGNGDLGTPGEAGSFIQPSPSPVPVPSAAWLMASGLMGLVSFSRRQKT